MSESTPDPVAALDWQRVIRDARDAVIAIDDGGTILAFNRAAEAMFRCVAADVVGSPVERLMPEPYRSEHSGYVSRYLETGERQAIGRIRQVEGLRADGETFPMELAVSETPTDDARLFTAIIRDVSELRALERRVEAWRRLAADRERRDDFAALIAQLLHDLGNPLAGLSAQAQLLSGLARRSPDAPLSTISEAANLIITEVHRLGLQIRELVTFSRQQQRLELEEIDVCELLERISRLWAPVAETAGIELSTECDDSEPVWGDPEKLRRVVENLVKNAIEAIDGAGVGHHVRVRVRRADASDVHATRGPGFPADGAGEGVIVSVEDDGPGLPPGLSLFRLFETTKENGSGVGLALARQFMQAHGGELRYEAVEPRGARFSATLPNAFDGPEGE